MTDLSRAEALIAAMDLVKTAKQDLDAARAILERAQSSFAVASHEYAAAATKLRDATAVFLGRPV